MAENTNLVAQDVDTVKAQLKAIMPLAKKLSQIDKTKLVETEDKFLVIRMVRLEHLIRETLAGKSYRS